MKKAYVKSQKRKRRNELTKSQGWAVSFLEEAFEYASSSILANFRRLGQTRRGQIGRYAIRVLTDKRLKQNERLRSGSIRLIVALLPKTFPILEKILSARSSPLWYEVHFTAFSAFDRSDFSKSDQQRVLALVEQYLLNAKSEAGFAAWKAGDMLGDEWYAPDTVEILARVVRSDRYVAGRNGALHGIQHAMNEATASEKERLVALVRKVASEDPSTEVRDYATYTLTSGGCAKHSA